jgi:hypothetical protein
VAAMGRVRGARRCAQLLTSMRATAIPRPEVRGVYGRAVTEEGKRRNQLVLFLESPLPSTWKPAAVTCSTWVTFDGSR